MKILNLIKTKLKKNEATITKADKKLYSDSTYTTFQQENKQFHI